MRLLADSSAFAKRYVLEDGSRQMADLLQETSELAVSIILIPEIVSALNRRLREGKLTGKQYHHLNDRLMDDVHDTVVLQLTPNVISHSVSLLEDHVLRAMDALHLACALSWKPDLFVTADKRQWKAAQQEGLTTEYIGSLN